MPRKLTNADFLDRARQVHGNKYNYSLADYISSQKKVVIICEQHGEFEQIPNSHLSGRGCPVCGKLEMSSKKRMNTDDFINKAKSIHGSNYDYSQSVYTHSAEKIKIICRTHGPFEQRAYYHLGGSGCSKCCEKKKR